MSSESDRQEYTDEIGQFFDGLVMSELVFRLSGMKLETRKQIIKDVFRSMRAKDQTRLIVELSDSVGHD